MHYACLSNERFAVEIQSESREDVTYEVSIRIVADLKNDRTRRLWTCSCPGWMMWGIEKPGFTCKHIRTVKEIHWCGWRQSVHGGGPETAGEEENIDHICPNCGNFAYPEDDLKIPGN